MAWPGNKIKNIYERIPQGYYESSIKNNIFQRFWHHRRFLAVTNLIKEDLSKSPILDIGCADGTFTKVIYDTVVSPNIFAIDISERAITFAKKRHPEINFVVSDCYHLPFPDKKFKTIFSLEVMEHLLKPEIAIAEMRRCLADDGYIIILVPNENLLFRLIWYFWIKLKGKVWKDAHVQKFSLEQLDRICKSSDLRIIHKQYLILKMLLLIKVKPNKKE